MKIPRAAHRQKMVIRRALQRAREGNPRAGSRSPSHMRNSLSSERLRTIRVEHGVGRLLLEKHR